MIGGAIRKDDPIAPLCELLSALCVLLASGLRFEFCERDELLLLIDLREIIGVPGGKVRFDFEPDMSDAPFGSIVRIKQPSRAAGNVTNSAGVLTFSANVDAVCICVCARCLKEFEYPVHKQFKAYLTEGGEGENPDGYFLQGDKVDAGEIIVTEFILNMDERLLCRDGCAGICQSCGLNLNDGPCSCKRQVDPRLAVLGKLLGND